MDHGNADTITKYDSRSGRKNLYEELGFVTDFELLQSTFKHCLSYEGGEFGFTPIRTLVNRRLL